MQLTRSRAGSWTQVVELWGMCCPPQGQHQNVHMSHEGSVENTSWIQVLFSFSSIFSTLWKLTLSEVPGLKNVGGGISQRKSSQNLAFFENKGLLLLYFQLTLSLMFFHIQFFFPLQTSIKRNCTSKWLILCWQHEFKCSSAFLMPIKKHRSWLWWIN